MTASIFNDSSRYNVDTRIVNFSLQKKKVYPQSTQVYKVTIISLRNPDFYSLFCGGGPCVSLS